MKNIWKKRKRREEQDEKEDEVEHREVDNEDCIGEEKGVMGDKKRVTEKTRIIERGSRKATI